MNVQAEEGTNLDQFAHDLLGMLRAVLLIQMHIENAETNADYSEENIKEMRKISAAIPEEKLVTMLDLALKRRAEIRYSPIPQLPLELLAVEISELLAKTNGTDGLGRDRSRPVLSDTGHPAKPLDGADGSRPVPTSPQTTDTRHTTKPTDSEDRSRPVPTPDVATDHKPENPIAAITHTIKNVITQITEPATTTTTLEQIKSKWSEIVAKAANSIPSLVFILKMCTPQELRGRTLVIGVPYSLHKEKMEAAKNRVTMETCLESIFSEKFSLSYTIVQPEPVAETDVSAIAADFGGEVVG